VRTRLGESRICESPESRFSLSGGSEESGGPQFTPKEYAASEKHFREAGKVAPDGPVISAFLGRMALSRNDFAVAVTHLRKAGYLLAQDDVDGAATGARHPLGQPLPRRYNSNHSFVFFPWCHLGNDNVLAFGGEATVFQTAVCELHNLV
jgi:hypothetical protein